MDKREITDELKISRLQIDKSPFYLGSNLSGPLDDLKTSLRRYGVLSPVWVTVTRSVPVLVHGFRRVLAAQALNIKTVPALIFSGVADDRLLHKTISENLSSRGLTLLEKVHAVRAFGAFGLTEKVLLQDIMPLLHLHPHPILLQQLRGLSRIHPDILEFLSSKDCPLKKASPFARLDKDADGFIAKIINAHRPGLNELEILTRYVVEAAQRSGVRPGTLFKKAKLDSDKLPPMNQLLSTAFEWRHPELSGRQKKIEALVHRIGFPPRVRLRWDATMEKTGLRLETDIHNKSDVLSLLHLLSAAPRLKLIETLLRELEGNSTDETTR